MGRWEKKTTEDGENLVAEIELRIELGNDEEARVNLTRNASDEKS